MITGKKPFTADTPVNTLLKQISESIPDPCRLVPEINPSVKKFLDRAMAKGPEDRYPTMKEYLLDFEGLRLQAQANRAAGQTSNSGFQPLPRKTEPTASSLEIGKSGLREVRANAGEPEPRIGAEKSQRRTWVAGILGLIAICVIFFGFRAWNTLYSKNAQLEAALQDQQLTAEAALTQVAEASERERATATVQPLAKMFAAQQTSTAQANRQTQTAAVQRAPEATQTAVQPLAVMFAAQANHQTQTAAVQRAPEITQTVAQPLAVMFAAQANRQTQTAAVQRAQYRVGDIIQFGRYEQDNDLSNGAEEIEWRILDIEEDTALVVSVMGLDAKPYNKEFVLITWEDCTLREWLNSEFYQKAFSESERKKIEITNNTTGNSEVYPIITDQVTEDYIFLLSNEEVETYLDSEEDNPLPTLYTWKKWDTAKTPYNEICCWWLRAPGNVQPITYSYPYLQQTYDVLDNYNVVRPALRINLGK